MDAAGVLESHFGVQSVLSQDALLEKLFLENSFSPYSLYQTQEGSLLCLSQVSSAASGRDADFQKDGSKRGCNCRTFLYFGLRGQDPVQKF